MHEERVTGRVEDLQSTEIPEVLRVASELYARDRAEIERAAQHRELLKAAAEAGLPPEYLDRAAAAIHARRLAHARRQQRWQAGGVAALALALGVALAPTRREVPSPYDPPMQSALAPPPAPILPLPAVDPAGSLLPVDLSGQVTHGLDQAMLDTPGNNLSDLGPGILTLAGVQFRTEGVVVVGPGQTESRLTNGPVDVPEEVEGIPIGRKARRLYFLHGTHFWTDPGTRIGAYVVHYQGGTRAEIPIRYGEDVLDWWAHPGAGSGPAESQVVWTGRNDAASRNGVGIRLFMKTWVNPHPERVIESLDMVTGNQPPGTNAPSPFLVAVTLGW
jgi:hypothetical protein